MNFKTTTEFKPQFGPDNIRVYHDIQGSDVCPPTVWLKIESSGVTVTAAMTPSEANEFAMAILRSTFEVRDLIEEIDARRPTVEAA